MIQQGSIITQTQNSNIQDLMSHNNQINSNNNEMVSYGNKPSTHSSMIFNNPLQNNLINQQNPLKQSMVSGYMNSNIQNMHNYPSMSNFSNTASHRNLNQHQNSIFY